VTVPQGEWAKPGYEGLNTEAAALWRKWLKLYEGQFDSFTYNVRVGRGLDPGPSVSEEIRRMWYMVTSKRIDVVSEKLGQTWIIEVEPRPGMRTYGQIHGYLQLLPKYRAVAPVLIGAVICERMGYDMAELFKAQSIPYFVFPPTGEPKLPPLFPPTFATPVVASKS
jgi:hypothetical protein